MLWESCQHVGSCDVFGKANITGARNVQALPGLIGRAENSSDWGRGLLAWLQTECFQVLVDDVDIGKWFIHVGARDQKRSKIATAQREGGPKSQLAAGSR